MLCSQGEIKRTDETNNSRNCVKTETEEEEKGDRSDIRRGLIWKTRSKRDSEYGKYVASRTKKGGVVIIRSLWLETCT